MTGVPDLPGANPLVPEVPLYPWPSTRYLEPDPEQVTGLRLVLPSEHLPSRADPSVFDGMDGFSRASPLLTLIPGGVDPASLPTPAESAADDSPILLVEVEPLRLVPFLAELDATADRDARRALILRPQVTLAANAEHVVLLRDGLRGPDGAAIPPGLAFRALRDGLPTDADTVEEMRAGFQPVLDVIDALGLDPDEVVAGWNFHTRSAEQVTGPAIAMHDAMQLAALPVWTPLSTEDDGANTVVEGVVQVPDFLGPDVRVALDEDGRPVVHGSRPMPFLVTIPHTVDAARPVLVFGHGFFSSRHETTWASLQPAIQAWRTPTVSIDFEGFTESDLVAAAPALAGDLVALRRVVDRQLQAQANHTALARLIENQLSADILVDGSPRLDGSRVNYLGISNGATQGAVILATSPRYARAALVVGGGGWSHMIQRATQWNTLGAILQAQVPDPAEMQLMLALMQQVFDPVDALNYADHLVVDRLPGRRPVELTMHMAVGDSQVANLVTEWVARAASVPMVVPSAREVWGMSTIPADPLGVQAPAGLVVYDEGYPPPPEGNVAPATDNGAHETIRDLPSYRDNVGQFLETGRVVQVCDGACDPG